MNTIHFNALLAAAHTGTYLPDTHFTDRVMATITHTEIISPAERMIRVTTKETFFMKLKQLPRFAIIAIALGALLLVSTSAYAAYQVFWAKPRVEISQLTTSENGRQQASLSLAQCGAQGIAKGYELKKGPQLSSEDMQKAIQAQCEMQAINAWVLEAYQPQYGDPRSVTPYTEESTQASMATTIKSRSDSIIRFNDDADAINDSKTFSLTKEVIYIADGQKVAATAIQESDPVVYVFTRTIQFTPDQSCIKQGCGGTGNPVGNGVLRAVIKLSLPLRYYALSLSSRLTEQNPCRGNEQDTCVNGGSIDIYMERASRTDSLVSKQIQGVVTRLDGTTVTLRGSSGALYSFTLPRDAIGNFNTNKADKYYEGKKVQVGSNIDVDYYAKEGAKDTSIPAEQINSVVFIIEVVRKTDPIKPY